MSEISSNIILVILVTSFATYLSRFLGVVILSTEIYARFELIFDWTIDYKSVALPIEL